MPKRKKKPEEVIDAGRAESPTIPVDPEIKREFEEAQRLAGAGSQQLRHKLAEHHSRTPEITAGDVDAAWDQADTGEETPGGSAPTPDQDVVDEIGEAVGLTYQDNELLDTERKLDRRDRRRWELEPTSSEDYQERQSKKPKP